MSVFLRRARDYLRKDIDREQRLERFIVAFSTKLWPFRESTLVLYVIILSALDYLSTFIALELSGNSQIRESGLLAKWALEMGGFLGLFVMDVTAIGMLICLAIGAKALYRKRGFEGLGHAAFVFLLMPYFILIWGVIANNIIVSFI